MQPDPEGEAWGRGYDDGYQDAKAQLDALRDTVRAVLNAAERAAQVAERPAVVWHLAAVDLRYLVETDPPYELRRWAFGPDDD